MLYYVQMKWTGSGYVYSICRKDTPASDAVCVYTTNNGFIGDFFILQDRIYFATSVDKDRMISTVDLNGENAYAITACSRPKRNCGDKHSGLQHQLGGSDGICTHSEYCAADVT